MDRYTLAELTFWDIHQWHITISMLVAVVVYEHLITLDREVQHLWKRVGLNLGTVLFFANRYFLYVVVALQATMVFFPLETKLCAPFFGAVAWATFVGTFIACAILTMRTVALWNNDKRVRIFFWILFLITGGVSLVSAILGRTQVEFEPIHKKIKRGCKLKGEGGGVSFLPYVMVAIYEMAIFVLTLIKSIPHLRQKHDRWVTTIYAQGLGFCAVTFAFSITNVLLFAFGPTRYRGGLTVVQYAVTSICCTRVIFALFAQRDMTRRHSLDPKLVDPNATENHIWTTVVYGQAGEESFWDEFDEDAR